MTGIAPTTERYNIFIYIKLIEADTLALALVCGLSDGVAEGGEGFATCFTPSPLH